MLVLAQSSEVQWGFTVEGVNTSSVVMTNLSPRIFILYILIPAVNLLTWYYVGLSSVLYIEPSCDDLYNQERAIRANKLREQMAALPCDYTDWNVNYTYTEAGEEERKRGVMGYKGCYPIMNPDFDSIIERVKTRDFDEYRSSRLAPMITLKGER